MRYRLPLAMPSKRSYWLVAGALAAAGAAGGAYWFEPWKLFVDAEAHDESPAGVAGLPVKVIAEGSFRSLEHTTTGRAKVLSLEDGTRVLRLEDLATSNGPKLVVMLSSTPATEDGWSAYDDGPHLVLEPLKGNRGSQNYPIPAEVDLSRYASAVVWCERFSVAFGSAPLLAP